ncbi:MAG: abortive infection system antitoxin AbiGi family protein [Bacteroidetes bacterium]|nr:abortive infection system antitoxin AbiGi family protein [Bacteroidota bacterium]
MSENLSANTLFHFTPTLTNLKNMMSKGIKIGYSVESYEALLNGGEEIGIPMICFCDIPLSRVKEHVSKYGGYAIGLTKEWGIQNKLTPVIYTHKNSPATELLNEVSSNIDSFINIHDKYKPIRSGNIVRSGIDLLFDKYNKLSDLEYDHKKEINNLIEELKSKISTIFKYVKPYKGKCFRNGEYLPDEVEFYNEKEWRFVPTNKQLEDVGLKDIYGLLYLNNEPDSVKIKRAINIRTGKLRLIFKPFDVRFIIVNKEDEIPSLIEYIDTIAFDKTSNKAIQILKTKIISLKQIIEDL